jgi:hypothetical protein
MAPLEWEAQKSPEQIMTKKCFPEPSVGRGEAAIQLHTLETGEFVAVRCSIYASDSFLQTKHRRRRN